MLSALLWLLARFDERLIDAQAIEVSGGGAADSGGAHTMEGGFPQPPPK